MKVEMKHIDIRKAELKDKEILKNLMQFYFYDFTEFIDVHPTSNGLFSDYPYLDNYWEEEGRYPYLVELQGKLAGFALIRLIHTPEKSYCSMAEFFILKKFRRTGLGRAVAHRMFDLHKGNWEVLQIEKNKPAQTFWRKVIHDYCDGKFFEREAEGKVIQEFVSR
ncbi:GNAT family N-acetyltransferase [Fictibacillus barbaricus]|uniref:Acetyltransferase n=1 Tax=Fictibacillus barbaricus TaxID=182136 RepID=A0ABU1U0T0_9BACL|nr:GNAT family N-acetyltransferase [Fictibacillus barbaricus]MDR7073084.1 putative acetyltransferase [Fictibacillus barbaricus]